MKAVAPIWAMIFAATGICLASADVDSFSCESTAGWAVIDPGGGAKAQLSSAPGRTGRSVELRQERTKKPAALAYAALLTGLARLEFDLWSEQAGVVLIAMEDRDGARFHHGVKVEAGTWMRVTLRPADFEPAPDSPKKRERLDPDRLGVGFGLLDPSAAFGLTGINALRVDNVTIERADPPDANLPARIEGSTEITAAGRHAGDLTIAKGGALRIRAARFVLAGSVRIDGGSLDVDGCALTIAGDFPHQRRIEVVNGGRVVLRGSILANPAIPMFDVSGGGTLEIDRAQPVTNGLSINANAGGTVTVRGTSFPGEFMIFPGSHVALEEVRAAMVWIALGANARGKVVFPDGASIADWAPDPGLQIDLRLKRCADVRWGLISTPGADVTVADSHLYAAAITLWGESAVAGLRNGDAAAAGRLQLPDRRLGFEKTTVDVWNVYAAPGSNVHLRDCLLGECWSMGDARLTLENSGCDGKGGYVTALDHSTFRLVNCTLDSEVIAQGSATMTLERCTAPRGVTASGEATLILKETKAAVKKIGAAKVEEIPGK